MAPKPWQSKPGVRRYRDKRTVAPRVDIFETDRELLMYADLPGVGTGDVDLRYEDGELVLQGKVTTDKPGQPLALIPDIQKAVVGEAGLEPAKA